MAGFRALAEQVRNPGLVATQRRTALRKCLERFAPYGHRATWHHLCTRAGIGTQDRNPDPGRLMAALAELEEARNLWLAYEEDFAARRRREKHEGIRQPGALHEWHLRTWGGCDIVPCESPHRHPTARLAEVLRRVIVAMESGRQREDCPVCGGRRFVWHTDGAHAVNGPVCQECGVVTPSAVLTTATLSAARRANADRAFAAA